jgi:hypothetical protein
MWHRYGWLASGAFALSVIGAVASYLWDSSFTQWPIAFVLVGTAFMFPLVVVRPVLAILAAFRDDSRSK